MWLRIVCRQAVWPETGFWLSSLTLLLLFLELLVLQMVSPPLLVLQTVLNVERSAGYTGDG